MSCTYIRPTYPIALALQQRCLALGPLAFILKSVCLFMAARTLEDLWRGGHPQHLSPLEALRAWALREAYREIDIPEKKLYAKIAEKVTKNGGGHLQRALFGPTCGYWVLAS